MTAINRLLSAQLNARIRKYIFEVRGWTTMEDVADFADANPLDWEKLLRQAHNVGRKTTNELKDLLVQSGWPR